MEKTELWVEVERDGCREVVAEYEDNPQGMDEARRHAREVGGVILEAEFEFSDSSLLEDYRTSEDDDSDSE